MTKVWIAVGELKSEQTRRIVEDLHAETRKHLNGSVCRLEAIQAGTV